MTEPEYRQDDLRDTGYCPLCGEPLSGLTVAARGFCDTHGWQYADWTPNRRPSDRDPRDETDDRRGEADMTAQGLKRSDMVRVGKHAHGPVFRYLKPWHLDPRMAWLEVPYTGRVFRFPLTLLRKAEQ